MITQDSSFLTNYRVNKNISFRILNLKVVSNDKFRTGCISCEYSIGVALNLWLAILKRPVGWQLENVDTIMQFTVEMSTDPAFSSDVVPKFYLNASLALWYV